MMCLRRLLCGLRGHDAVLHFEGRRLMVRCTSCGHDSPGWELGGRAPSHHYPADPAKLASSGLRFVSRRSA